MIAENVTMLIVLAAFVFVVYAAPASSQAICNYAIGFGLGANAVTKWYTYYYLNEQNRG